MIKGDIWEILKIAPTNDKKEIKRAYAKQSAIYHPEDNPEEFKQIQAAYQQAMAQTRNKISSYQGVDIDKELSKNKPVEIIVDQYQEIIDENINIEIEDIGQYQEELVKKRDDNSIIIDDVIIEPVKRHRNDLDIEIEAADNQFLNEQDYYQYVLTRIDNQLKQDCSIKIVAAIFDDEKIINALSDLEFKKKIEKIILKYSKLYSEETIHYLFKQAKEYQLKRITGQLPWTKQKKALLRFHFIIFMGVIVMAVMFVNDKVKQDKKDKIPKINIQDIVDNNTDIIGDMKNKMFDMSYSNNKAFLNGLVIESKDGGYKFYDENGNQLLDQMIRDVQFTLSNMLVVKIGDSYYLYDCQTRSLNDTAFLKIHVINVSYQGDETVYKKLLTNLDGNSWKICDTSGNEEIVIAVNTVVPPNPIKANVDENGIVTIT